jgi:hypothetical protein
LKYLNDASNNVAIETNAMDDAYYLLVNGAQAGPYAPSQLQSMWQLGQITADTIYWQDGFDDWQSINHLKELLNPEKNPDGHLLRFIYLQPGGLSRAEARSRTERRWAK